MTPLFHSELEALFWFSSLFAVTVLLFYYFATLRKNSTLQRSVEELERLIESTIEGIIIFDSEKRCIKSNSVARRMLGYRTEEMEGMNVLAFISQRSREIVKSNVQVQNMEPYEVELRRKDGSCFFALVRGRDIEWEGQKIRVSTLIDISRMKRMQHDLERFNTQLEEKVQRQVEAIRERDQMLLHQSKLAAMGEMIGAISHQWRQPLNELSINIQNLDDDYAEGLIDEAFIEDFIARNSEIITFMSRTIDDFRNFFRIDKTKEAFSVRRAVENTIRMQSARLKRGGISVVVKGEDIVVTGYRHEFKQVLITLISNAADVLHRSDHLHVKEISIVLQENRMQIEDNGGGVDPKVIDRIFEPYFTTKSEGEGTGLGLYIAKVIIEKNMGGTLEVRNSSKGARFEITFPDSAIVHIRQKSVPALES